MQSNIKTALVKNLRGLATNLKGLTDEQLDDNASAVREFTEALENTIARLHEDGKFVNTSTSDDVASVDENATLRAELSELREALIESTEIRESLQRIENSLKTLNVRNEPNNG